jgi:hypothetical protein
MKSRAHVPDFLCLKKIKNSGEFERTTNLRNCDDAMQFSFERRIEVIFGFFRGTRFRLLTFRSVRGEGIFCVLAILPRS